VTPVAVEHTDALAVAELPAVHRDPFDRLLVTQSHRLGAPLVTADPIFGRYDVAVIWH
jgi:PIN domain nuclease of toxin-antitoxin system